MDTDINSGEKNRMIGMLGGIITIVLPFAKTSQ